MPNDADPAQHALQRTRTMHAHAGRRAIVRAALRTVAAATLLITAYALMPIDVLSRSELVFRVIVAAVLVVLTVVWQIWAVDRSPVPQLRAAEALVVTVSVVVFSFAAAYLNLSHRDPAAFTEVLGKTSALYFTMTTLATVGYGDISARTDSARIAVMVQMIVNVAVIGSAVRLIIHTARVRLTASRAEVERVMADSDA